MTFKPVFLLCFFAILRSSSAKCVTPRGISNPSLFANVSPNSPVPDDSVFLSFFLITLPAIARLEAPVQFHTLQGLISKIFNTMGAFEDRALDTWGKQPPARFCKNSTNFALYRSVTLAHVAHLIHCELVPGLSARFDAQMTKWGLDPNMCRNMAVPTACDDVRTPWGMAFHRLKEYHDWIARDGWNRDGSLSRTFNRIPYQDWSSKPYVPSNSPWKTTRRTKWQPLLEHGGRGFLFHQEHVTPHIGQFARSFFADDMTYCSRSAPNPKYNYAKELNLLILRSASMAEDDTKKAKIEIFDNKIQSLCLLPVGILLAQNKSGDSWEFIETYMIGATALYESVLLVWREKIKHDAIRPPTRLRSDRSGRLITAFAGPIQGKKSMPAEDWEPFIRTMPHAEYPSGSSCFCEAFSKAMALQFGTNDFDRDGVPSKIRLTQTAGNSIVEQGMPVSDVMLVYSKWSDVSKDCGQSRLDGGMHFTAAIGAGEDLCRPMAQIAYDAIKALTNGKKPSFVQQFDRKLAKQKRCK